MGKWFNSPEIREEIARIAATPGFRYEAVQAMLAERGIAVPLETVSRRLRKLGHGRGAEYAGRQPGGVSGQMSGQGAHDPAKITRDEQQKGTPEYFQHLERAAALWQRDNAPAGFYRIDLSHETRPVAVSVTSDWHVGGKAVAYQQLREDLAELVGVDGAYTIGAGDWAHNHKSKRKSATALYQTIAEPSEQWDWITDITLPLRERKKLLGYVKGNHEDFDWQEAGLDMARHWCQEHGIPYWGHGGTVEITVGTQRYYGVVRHQYPGASSLNKGNNARRVYDSLVRPVEAAHLDFIYLGHLHYGHLEQADRAAGECHYLRGGSYLIYSEHADERYGAWMTSPSNPTLILYPDRREVLSFKGKRFGLALQVLAWERARYAAMP